MVVKATKTEDLHQRLIVEGTKDVGAVIIQCEVEARDGVNPIKRVSLQVESVGDFGLGSTPSSAPNFQVVKDSWMMEGSYGSIWRS